MSKRKRVSVCCGAPVRGERAYSPRQKFFTCSKCGQWPVETKIIFEEGEENGERNSGKEREAI